MQQHCSVLAIIDPEQTLVLANYNDKAACYSPQAVGAPQQQVPCPDHLSIVQALQHTKKQVFTSMRHGNVVQASVRLAALSSNTPGPAHGLRMGYAGMPQAPCYHGTVSPMIHDMIVNQYDCPAPIQNHLTTTHSSPIHPPGPVSAPLRAPSQSSQARSPAAPAATPQPPAAACHT